MTIPAEIVAAIQSVRSKVKSLKKEDFNPHGGYKYVSIDTFYEKVMPLATEAGLIWRVREQEYNVLEGQGRNKDTAWVKARYAFDLYKDAFEAAEWMTVTILAPVAGAQTAGQLYSYADKVFMRVAFGVPTGEADADANASEPLVSHSSPKGVDPILGPVGPAPVAKAEMPKIIGTEAPKVEPPTDPATGEVFASEEAKLAPNKSKAGDPLIDTRAISNADSCKMIYKIFQTWMPYIKTKAQLTDWHALNLAAINTVKTHDPDTHQKIRELFTARNAELGGTKSRGT